jgi:hypothetical protein
VFIGKAGRVDERMVEGRAPVYLRPVEDVVGFGAFGRAIERCDSGGIDGHGHERKRITATRGRWLSVRGSTVKARREGCVVKESRRRLREPVNQENSSAKDARMATLRRSQLPIVKNPALKRATTGAIDP